MSIFVVSNALTFSNQQLVKNAGITSSFHTQEFVTVVFEDFDFMVLGSSARVKHNNLRILRFSEQFDSRDCIDVDLRVAQIREIRLWDKSPNIKPEFRLPVGFQPVRPVRGVRWSFVGDEA